MSDVIASLQKWSRTRADEPAFSDGRCQLTYGELAPRVGGFAAAAKLFPPVVGILADNAVDWAIADLGLTAAGRTLVPLPTSFSKTQLQHVIADSGVMLVLHDADAALMAAELGVHARRLADLTGPNAPLRGAPTVPRLPNRIVYTSGTTGAPKGVKIGKPQIDFMTRALAEAIGADSQDRYMSVLPFALLLEQLCGIHVPVLVGGESRLVPSVAIATARGLPSDIAAAALEVRPTVSVLVPALLGLWLSGLGPVTGVPDSLRYVAVGGAPIAPWMAQAAWAAGIPVHEGYGLSECTSVVALNRFGARVAGTVGRPLNGINVTISGDGEIVVTGPSVMDGYLGGQHASTSWSTGDLGAITPAGNLIVHGRRDNVLVTAFGRNVSPEWIEPMLTGDRQIAQAVLLLDGELKLTALLGLNDDGMAWAAGISQEAIMNHVTAMCRDAPAYARPERIAFCPIDDLLAGGVLGPCGRIDRRRAADCLAEMVARRTEQPMTQTQIKESETA